MSEIRMYTTAWCGYCLAAKQLFERESLSYEEISVDDDPDFRQRMQDLSGRHTVPQIFIDGEAIGGYQELARLIADGGLAAPDATPTSI
jgi:glutaredoxin 3